MYCEEKHKTHFLYKTRINMISIATIIGYILSVTYLYLIYKELRKIYTRNNMSQRISRYFLVNRKISRESTEMISTPGVRPSADVSNFNNAILNIIYVFKSECNLFEKMIMNAFINQVLDKNECEFDKVSIYLNNYNKNKAFFDDLIARRDPVILTEYNLLKSILELEINPVRYMRVKWNTMSDDKIAEIWVNLELCKIISNYYSET